MAEQELWELADPSIPTHVEGSALDKVLLLSGAEAHWDLPPPEPEQWELGIREGSGGPEDDFYSAETSLVHA